MTRPSNSTGAAFAVEPLPAAPRVPCAAPQSLLALLQHLLIAVNGPQGEHTQH